ncbi:MAG TPA: TlpA disulfide reductase family protein [Rubrivivax sp.]|nr:TlpA disulfide reductase family protein [Rubrivivax sp.]
MPRPPQRPDLARRAALLTLLAAAAATGCDSRPPAPTFAYTLLDGAQGRTDALRGKVLLVNFWATTCTTCIREMPALAALHRQYEARGLATLAVSMRLDPPAAVADFAEERGLPFGVVIDNTGAIARAFPDLQATPTTYVIDKRGAIARRYVGEPDFQALRTLVETLLAESPAAA